MADIIDDILNYIAEQHVFQPNQKDEHDLGIAVIAKGVPLRTTMADPGEGMSAFVFVESLNIIGTTLIASIAKLGVSIRIYSNQAGVESVTVLGSDALDKRPDGRWIESELSRVSSVILSGITRDFALDIHGEDEFSNGTYKYPVLAGQGNPGEILPTVRNIDIVGDEVQERGLYADWVFDVNEADGSYEGRYVEILIPIIIDDYFSLQPEE